MAEWGVSQWVLAQLAALMAGLAKTGVPGVGIVAVPVFALLLPARESVGIVLLVLICADLMAVATYRRDAEWKHILRISPWTITGIAVGSVALGKLQDTQVKQLIGAILLPMVGLSLWRRWLSARGVEEKPLPFWAAVLAGIAAGFTTMVANAAGPIMVLYLLAMRLPKLAFLGTAAWYFFCLNWVKVPFGVHAGIITPASVKQSALLFPGALVGGILGRTIVRRLPQALFENLALLFTALSALWFLAGPLLLTLFRRG